MASKYMTGETDRVYRTVVSFVIKSGGSEFYGLQNNRRNLLIVERPTTDYYFSAYHMQADHRSRWQTELHGVSSCSICKKNRTVAISTQVEIRFCLPYHSFPAHARKCKRAYAITTMARDSRRGSSTDLVSICIAGQAG